MPDNEAAEVKRCEYCNKAFKADAFHPRKRYCSPKCNKTVWMSINREAVLAKKRIKSRIITETRKENVKRYNQNHKERRRISTQKWRHKNLLRGRAHARVRHAVKAGRIIKLPCWCGDTKSQAHHEDYSKPLEVVWLCQKHHKELHRRYA